MPPQNRYLEKIDLDSLLDASSNLPVFLYPCQIETRIFENRLLKIRIYPDQIAISRMEKALTKIEFLDGRRYHIAVDAIKTSLQKLVNDYGNERSSQIIEKTEKTEKYSELKNGITEEEFDDARLYHELKSKPKAIWGKLAQDYGTHRAAWIIHSTKDITQHREYRNSDVLHEPQIKLLPSFFLVTLYPDHGSPLRAWCQVKPPLKVLSISEESILSGKGILSGEAAWVADFKIAEDKGMAVQFHLKDDINKILKITVVGIQENASGATLLKELFEDHHYTVGNGFPKFNTPTNNTATTLAGFTKKENMDSRFEQEFGERPDEIDDCNADRLAKALGFNENEKALITKWQYGWDRYDYYTKDLHSALWNVTGGYFLNNFIKGAIDDVTESKLRIHFEDYVRPAGMLPTIRIGNLPYGILPVTQIRDWKSARLDSEHLPNSQSEEDGWEKFDSEFHKILMFFYGLWENSIKDVPRVGDTQNLDTNLDEDLIRILAISANSRSYALRPYVDDRLIGWFLSQLKSTLFSFLAGKRTPEECAKDWVIIWRSLQKELAEFLKGLGVNQATVDSSRLMETIAWSDSKPLNIPLVSSKSNPNDNPDNYIPLLDVLGSQAPKNASGTLLYALLHRALAHDSNLKPWKLMKRDQKDTERKILEFFNNVTNSQEIVDRIIDDPQFRLKVPNRVYGIRPSLAERIIEVRNNLENKKFTGIEQIDRIPMVGIDTLNDIKFSFSQKVAGIDYESLLKGVFDLFTHRLDAWISSLASKRLDSMRRKTPEGLIIGAYGFVENLPITGNQPGRLATGGYIHAPSLNQATTAALLKSGFLTHQGEKKNPYRINLGSDRIRRAFSIMEGISKEQSLGELLGYQFERDLHERRLDQYKDEFRKAFPLVAQIDTSYNGKVSTEKITARNVVDGLSLVKSFEGPKDDFVKKISEALSIDYEVNEATRIAKEILDNPGIKESIELLREAMDGYTDALIHESVYQVVSDNYVRGSAAMDASTGIGVPPELESLTTPLESDDLGNKICILLNDISNDYKIDQPRERAEPRLATWFQKLLGDMSRIGCCVRYYEKEAADGSLTIKNDTVTLDQLDLGPLDFLYLSVNRGDPGLVQCIKTNVRAKHKNLVEEIIEEEGKNRVIKPKPIEIYYGPYQNNPYQPIDNVSYERCLDDAIELAYQVLSTISRPVAELKPENLCDSGEGNGCGFSSIDYDQLMSRACEARESLLKHMQAIQRYVKPLEYLERAQDAYKNIEVIMTRPEEILAQTGLLPQQVFLTIETSLLKYFENVDLIKDALSTGIASHLTTLAEEHPDKTPQELIELASEGIIDLAGKQLKALLVAIFRSTLQDEDGNIQPIFDDGLEKIMEDSADLLSGLSGCISHIDAQIKVALDLLFRFGILIDQPKGLTAEWLQGRVNAASERLQKTNLPLLHARSYYNKAQEEGDTEKEQDDGKANEDMKKAVSAIIEAMKALFGDNFIVLPTFILPEGEKFKTYMNAQETVLNSRPVSRIHLWLQQAAQTHTAVQNFEEMLQLIGPWYGSEILNPIIVQLPYRIEDDHLKDSLGWQALSDKELGIVSKSSIRRDELDDDYREKRPRGTTGIAVFCEGPIVTERVCGLMIDQWTEPLPHGTVDTAIALHADTPNQQPPNCCLLAVPGNRQLECWTPRELEAIVSDTLDLARIRAVDLDALPDLKGLLPALFLPISPEQDFFGSKPFLPPIKEIAFLNPSLDGDE